MKHLFVKRAVAATLAAALPMAALAADKPESLKIGMTAFLTGPASVFGVPARDATEILVENINADGGINGVPIEVSFIDEGAGAESLTSEYRRMVEIRRRRGDACLDLVGQLPDACTPGRRPSGAQPDVGLRHAAHL